MRNIEWRSIKYDDFECGEIQKVLNNATVNI